VTVDQTTRRNQRREQAEATRRQLLEAAGDVFERRGYRATTVGAITERADTAHGTFYLYFRNKEDVFCQVIEAVVVDELVDTTMVPVDGSPREAVERGVRAFVGVFDRHKGLWRALLEGMLLSPRVRELWLQLRRDLVMRIAHAFEVQQRSGRARPFDATMVAHSLAAMAEWSAFTHLVLGEPDPEAGPDREALVATLADLWDRAVRATPAGDVGAGEGDGQGGAGGPGGAQIPPSA